MIKVCFISSFLLFRLYPLNSKLSAIACLSAVTQLQISIMKFLITLILASCVAAAPAINARSRLERRLARRAGSSHPIQRIPSSEIHPQGTPTKNEQYSSNWAGVVIANVSISIFYAERNVDPRQASIWYFHCCVSNVHCSSASNNRRRLYPKCFSLGWN